MKKQNCLCTISDSIKIYGLDVKAQHVLPTIKFNETFFIAYYRA